jgi:alpha-glucosidase (family GH31 glycosyl hydrolase)
MPRGAYTGSSQYGVFWGGDVGGTQEGLRASIIAVQRSAVMGYPNWGSDTCGYNQQLLEQEVCGRWLGFSALTPIMEVGPTRNVSLWNLPREPAYDTELIAMWRLYARLHQRLIDYSYRQAQEGNQDRHADSSSAVSGRSKISVSLDQLVDLPVRERPSGFADLGEGKTDPAGLPAGGGSWRDAWSGKVYRGGQTITVNAELHQIPLFVAPGREVNPGDLNQEWKESHAIAEKKPESKSARCRVESVV